MKSVKGKAVKSDNKNNSDSGVEKFSKPDMQRTKERFDDFEYLNMFSKQRFDNMSEEKIRTVLVEYTLKMIPKSATSPHQTRMRNEYRYEKMFDENNGYEQVREELKKIQSSLLESISTVRSMHKQPDKCVSLTFTGNVRAYYNSETNKYEVEYLPKEYSEKFSEKNMPDLKMECEMIKSKYFEAIIYLLQEIPKERFKLCEKCGTPFFQQTIKARTYCSFKCIKAVAQVNYIKKKKEMKTTNQ